MTHRCCDILIIGGGPAGSTAASLLVQQGWHVVLIEKAQHPRFHIGESLLPCTLPLLDKLGIHDAIKKIALIKNAATFFSPDHAHSISYRFSNALQVNYPHAYQIKRADFDHILFNKAKQHGVETYENHQAMTVEHHTSQLST
ncbi:MAG: tryptophan 7-halogenase, partial [Gammaproteobacteria bacterium]|nr:tryptophan 7-halogenase [Gammaproteobacteria bacterium]